MIALFDLIWRFIYSAKSQQLSPQGALYFKVKSPRLKCSVGIELTILQLHCVCVYTLE